MNDSAQSINIDLGFFAGPMDLLLHLVHEKQISVEAVDMRVVAEQYLEIISSARLVDLERASEYLVIAATLLALKSDILVKAHSPESLDHLVNENSQDEAFLEELRERLKQYELIKKRSRMLAEMPQLGIDTFTRRYRPNRDEVKVSYDLDGDAGRLADLFGRLLKRIGGYIGGFKISRSEVAVVDLMVKIIESVSRVGLAGTKVLSFSRLVADEFKLRLRNHLPDGDDDAFSEAPKERTKVIGYFLAVLELVKRGAVGVIQVEPDEDISITPVTGVEESIIDLHADNMHLNVEAA